MMQLFSATRVVLTPSIIFLVHMVAASLCGESLADDNRPLYVEITELQPHKYRVGIRVPPSIPPFNQPSVILPDSCVPQIDAAGRATPRIDIGITYQNYNCEAELAGQTIEIHFPHSQTVATVIRITLENGLSHTTVLAPGESRWRVPETETRSSVARDYLRLGVHHIWAGNDHLLFLICLIFIAGSFGRILVTITGFTVAHSLTLALSALGVVRLPVAPIEAAIALSVVFLATEVSKGRRESLTWRYPITVSSLFGLLHGLGFAAVLNEIGLPQAELVTGLLFFNVGVEIGQVAFAVVVMAAFALLHRAARYSSKEVRFELGLQKIMGYAAGCLAAFWLFERVANFR
jgi:hypothetical protein